MSKKTTVNSFSALSAHVTNIFGDNGGTGKKIVLSISNIYWKASGKVLSDVKAKHPWEDKKGHLTRSLSRKREELGSLLYTRLSYATYLYYGTKWHWVRPDKKGHKVSGVWMGRKRTGRAKGVRSTTKNNKNLKWFEKAWRKRRLDTLKKASKQIYKELGF